jgi:hypothetical protein
MIEEKFFQISDSLGK